MSRKQSVTDRAFLATSGMDQASQPPSTVKPAHKPMTGPGVMVAHLAKESETLIENQRLKDELASWAGASPNKKLDTTLIIASRWANRHTDSFTTDAFDELKAEIESAGGNIQPIKVRPIPGSEPQTYEIVFGHRRHRACQELGLQVLAMIESIDDRALFEDMDRENRQRADLRPYEQGEMYRRALDEGLYPSLRALSEAIGLQPGNVSTAIKIARLPSAVLDAFPSRLDIQYRWAVPLADLVEKDLDVVLARAKTIADSRKGGEQLSPADVFSRLTQPAGAASAKTTPDRHIRAGDKQVATVKVSKGRYVIEFEKGVLTDEKVSKIEAAIAKLMA